MVFKHEAFVNEEKVGEWFTFKAEADDRFGDATIVTSEVDDVNAFRVETKVEQQKSKIAEGLAAQQRGAEIMAFVWHINTQKGITGQQIQGLLMDPMLQEIQQLLWVGALKTAKAVIEQYNNPFYTAEEKAQILSLFD